MKLSLITRKNVALKRLMCYVCVLDKLPKSTKEILLSPQYLESILANDLNAPMEPNTLYF